MHGTIMLLLYATPDRVRVRQRVCRCRSGPRRGVPAAERVLVLAVPARRAGRDRRLLAPRRRGRLRLDAYPPLSNAVHSPGIGGDLWVMGLIVSGLGTILGAVNMITTIVCLRAPGMTMFRMPIFTWNILSPASWC
jgi:cytochrome c oxidase subunit 1